MLRHLIVPILLLINLMGLAQEKVIYDPNVVKRTVGAFNAISVTDGIDLYLSQGGESVVAVSAKDVKARDEIRTVVENGTLRIYLSTGWNWMYKKLRAYVSVKDLTRLKASGGSDIQVKDSLNCDTLNIVLSGGSDFSGKIAVNYLIVEQSGGSDASVKGNAVNAKIVASGGSDFRGYELIAENAILKTSGGSDASITVVKEMAAVASGGSDVNYKGSPVIKYKSASGGGSISNRGQK